MFAFKLYRVSLNVHAALLHKRKHLKGEALVVVRVFEPRGGIHWHQFGLVMVVHEGTPGEKRSVSRVEKKVARSGS